MARRTGARRGSRHRQEHGVGGRSAARQGSRHARAVGAGLGGRVGAGLGHDRRTAGRRHSRHRRRPARGATRRGHRSPDARPARRALGPGARRELAGAGRRDAVDHRRARAQRACPDRDRRPAVARPLQSGGHRIRGAPGAAAHRAAAHSSHRCRCRAGLDRLVASRQRQRNPTDAASPAHPGRPARGHRPATRQVLSPADRGAHRRRLGRKPFLCPRTRSRAGQPSATQRHRTPHVAGRAGATAGRRAERRGPRRPAGHRQHVGPDRRDGLRGHGGEC